MLATADTTTAHNSPSSPARSPTISNAAAAFGLPSGSRTNNRRRERPQSITPGFDPLEGPSASYSHPAGSAIAPGAPAQMLQRQGSRRSRRRERAVEIYSGLTRTPSPSPLRRDPNVDGTSNTSSVTPSASKIAAIEELRKSLQTTKIHQHDSSSQGAGDATPMTARSQTTDNPQRPRASSEPGLRGPTQIVMVEKHVVP